MLPMKVLALEYGEHRIYYSVHAVYVQDFTK